MSSLSPTERTLVMLALGAGSGALAGAAAFTLIALAFGAIASPAGALADPRIKLWAFACAAAATVALAEAWRVRPVQASVRLLAGAAAGAAAGAGLYAGGYVAVFHPDVGVSPAVAGYFGEALRGATRLEAMLAVLGAAIGALASRYGWRLPGLLAFLGLTAVAGGYVAYALTVSLPRTPPSSLPFSIALFVAETATLGMVLVYAFYSLDVFQRQRWERAPERRPFSRFYLPRLAFQVPTFNEPTEMVQATLDALARIEYPKDRYLVMVADDSTDPECADGIRKLCEERGFTYLHREDRRGFKAGALNNALRVTPRDVEIVAVLDADYRVLPEYLRETVGYFIDPNLGFLQTPQDYYNRDETFLTRQYYLADAYFYRAILPSRNEGNAIIFCGTMGMIRRGALETAGGWGEDYICEDAELSVRIFREGWDALYVSRTYGRGLIPATFDAYKKQHTRWAFGCVKVLVHYAPRVLFSRVSVRQKLDFILGNLHWFDGVYIVIIAGAIAMISIAGALGLPFATHHETDVALLALIPVFLVLDGLLRMHGALRAAVPVSLMDTVRTQGMWLSIKFATSYAAVRSAFGATMPFVRTPRGNDGNLPRSEAAKRAVRLTRFETVATVVMLLSGLAASFTAWRVGPDAEGFLGRVLLAVWSVYYAATFACAPVYAYLSYRTFKGPTPIAIARPAPVVRNATAGPSGDHPIRVAVNVREADDDGQSKGIM